MTALTPVLREFLDSEPVGVLATQAADGRPRQSLVYFTRDGDRLLISTTCRPAQGPRRATDRLGDALRHGP
jgi:hypothetical protein